MQQDLSELYLPTAGNGNNCFFHASFGQLKDGQLIEQNASKMRKQYTDFLSEYKPIGNRDLISTHLKDALSNIFLATLANISEEKTVDLMPGSMLDKLKAYVKRFNEADKTYKKKLKEILKAISKLDSEPSKETIKFLKTVHGFDETKFATQLGYRKDVVVNHFDDIVKIIDPNYKNDSNKEQIQQEFCNLFFNEKEVFQYYLNSFQKDSYLILTEEIPILAMLATKKIFLYEKAGDNIVKRSVFSSTLEDLYSANLGWIKKYHLDNNVSGDVHIFHSNLHYSRVSPLLLSYFKDSNMTQVPFSSIKSTDTKDDQGQKNTNNNDTVMIEIVTPAFPETRDTLGGNICLCLYKSCGWLNVYGMFSNVEFLRTPKRYDEEALRQDYEREPKKKDIDYHAYLEAHDTELLLQRSRETYYQWARKAAENISYTSLAVACVVIILEGIRVLLNGLSGRNVADLNSPSSISLHFAIVAVTAIGAFVEHVLKIKATSAERGLQNTEGLLKRLGFFPIGNKQIDSAAIDKNETTSNTPSSST